MNPLSVLRSMRPTLVLMSGRAAGFVATFAIPLALARLLDPSEFGTYRFLFLMYGTLLGFAQFGMAESLYYFLPRRPEAAGRWVGNAVATLAVLGALVGTTVAILAPQIATFFSNPLLAEHLPKLGIFLGLILASTTLEIVMVCRRRYQQAATTYGISDMARALMLVVPALMARTLEALLAGAIAFAAVRCLLAIWYLARTFGRDLRVDGTLWRQQLTYTLPFAAAIMVELVQVNLHQYAVALWFGPVMFAIYSIGWLQTPVVDLLATSAANVLMVSMSEQAAKKESPLPLWHATVERLSFVFVPLAVVLMLTAHHVIVLLFTEAYAAAVPIFMISLGSIVLATLQVDAVLRVYAQIRTMLVLQVIRLTIIASTIAWFVGMFHLQGAVLVTLLATATAKTLALAWIARLTGTPMWRLLPWASLAGIWVAALAAAGPAWLVRTYLDAAPLVIVLATGAVYGGTYLGLLSLGARLRPAGAAAAEARAA
jgi:O-antigen/teichoic acid export membrane protein